MRYSALAENDFVDMRIVPDIMVKEVDHEDLDTTPFTYSIPVPVGTFVLGVGVHVVEALAGGAATMTIGDGDSANGWLTSALIVPGTKDAFVFSAGATVTNTQGKYYPDGGVIKITCVTGLTAGKVKVMLYGFNLKGTWRQADL